MILETKSTTELVASYRAAIAEKHEAGKRADEKLREAILSKSELTRETGELISSARGDLKDREFAEATSFLDDAAVRAYLKFARLNREPVTDLETAIHSIRLALQPSGAIEFPDGHGAQNSHDPPPFFSWASHAIMQFKVAWAKYLHAKPLESWSIHEAEQFAYALRPILKVHKQVTDWIQRR